MVYYTLGNLSPRLRSKLPSIQLLAMVKTKLVKKYTMPAILSPIVDDIKKLVRKLMILMVEVACSTSDFCPTLYMYILSTIPNRRMMSN